MASILNATTPLFTVAVAHLLTYEEKATVPKIVGVLLGLTGVAVLIGPGVLAGLGTDVVAQLAVLGAAVSYAFAGVYGRRFKRMGFDPIATATGQVTASALVLLPIALVVDRPWTMAPPSGVTLAALLGPALLSTALAYILFFRILATAGPTNVFLVTFLNPVSAIALGVVVLGEGIALGHLIGMMLIGCGLAAIDGRVFEIIGWRRRSSVKRNNDTILGRKT